MFQQYPQSDVNEPIPLHEGRFRVWAGDRCVEGSGSAHLRWLPSPGIEFDIEITEPFPGVGFNSLTVELPGFRTENVVAHSMTLGLTSRIRAFASTMEWDREQNLLSVGFQVVNFTDFITPGLSAGLHLASDEGVTTILYLYFWRESAINLAWPMNAHMPSTTTVTNGIATTTKRSRGCGRWRRARHVNGIRCSVSTIGCNVSTIGCDVRTIG